MDGQSIRIFFYDLSSVDLAHMKIPVAHLEDTCKIFCRYGGGLQHFGCQWIGVTVCREKLHKITDHFGIVGPVTDWTRVTDTADLMAETVTKN